MTEKERKNVVKVAAKFVNLLKKEGVLEMVWVTESIILITILIVILLVLFTLSNVRSVVNSTLEAQSRRLKNALITTRVVCLGMEGVGGEYRGFIYMYISLGRTIGDWMIL